jgi:MoaA/NifB/PqqE/SkfB family radical SAM enzyme
MLPTLKSLKLRVVLTTSIMRENIDDLLPIAQWAFSRRVGVGYSCYSSMKTGDHGQSIRKEQMEKLKQIIADLCRMKKEVGLVESSFSYLKRVPEFFEKGRLGRCLATKSWLYILPDGHLKICPDKEIYVHYSSYSGPIPIACRDCWYTCRGEMETTFLERLWEAWQKWMALRRSSGSFSGRS